MTAAFLSLRGVSKRYGGQAAVDGLDLDIAQGEFVSLLGPSGCGKTTTLHMIAGFVTPDAGDIRIDGVSVTTLPSHQRGAAMVFQSYALFPHMTVFDNVAFGLRMRKTSRDEIAARVADALALVRLAGMERRLPGELSGGQQQRVALARALVLSPRLLLLDEPLSNLDARLRESLRQEFVEIHRLTGMTTILVTHDLEEAFATSDRVAVLSHGQLQQFDTPRRIYTQPRTSVVAAFVGHRNRLGGAAIPAHALRVSAQPLALDVSMPATLAVLAYLGATVQFEVDVDGQRLAGEQTAGDWVDALRVGDAVHVGWNAADLIKVPDANAGPRHLTAPSDTLTHHV